MEINNFSIFNTDNKCYEPKSSLADTTELNKYIGNNFERFNFVINNDGNGSLVETCKNKALEKNKPLFLITNLSREKIGNNNFKYDCLIPLVNKICDFSNIENLLKPFEPFNTLIDDLFGSGVIKNSGEKIDTVLSLNNDTKNIDFETGIDNCVSFTKNGMKNNFSKSGKFIIYKTELVDNKNFENSLNVQPYHYYNTEYNNLINSKEGILNEFQIKFKEFICKPNNTKENELDNSILKLKQHYKNIFSALDKISLDVSNLVVVTKYDTLYLEKLQTMIDDKKEELKSLIGFDGGNNGKLGDTKFLKNLKISENIILFFIITFIIYAYAKKLI